MTLPECYAALGGNYEDVLTRLRSERLVQRFVLKFLDDGSYQLLLTSLAAGDRDEAFRAAHTIKGMCQNLSFTTLERSASALTEILRDGGDADPALVAAVQADYEKTAAAIRTFAESIS